MIVLLYCCLFILQTLIQKYGLIDIIYQKAGNKMYKFTILFYIHMYILLYICCEVNAKVKRHIISA